VQPSKAQHYDHFCGQTKAREDAEKELLGNRYVQNRKAGGPRDCQTQKALVITTLLQLPPDYLRRFWFQIRIHERRGKAKAKTSGRGKGDGSKGEGKSELVV
jgi:hypothetical protein